MRILFMTKKYSSFGAICLNHLLQAGFDVSGVVIVSRFDKRKSLFRNFANYMRERGISFIIQKVIQTFYIKSRVLVKKINLVKFILKEALPLTVAELLVDYPMKLLSPENVNDKKFLALINPMELDLIITCEFSQILERDIISVPKIGCVNLHPSLLPKYRGPAPIFWVLYHEEKMTGITIHWIDEKIDTGDILAQQKISILPEDDDKTLRQKIAQIAAVQLVSLLQNGSLKKRNSVRQSDVDASYYKRPKIKEIRESIKKIKARKKSVQ